MLPSPADTLLVIDDNPADIHLLTMAWSEAGYDGAIALHACHSCPAALRWIEDGKGRGLSPKGILTDLMLFDHDSLMAIEILQKLPGLEGVPMVTWSGIEAGRLSTDRITRRGIRIWRKPPDWESYPRFVRRLRNLLIDQSSSSSSRLHML